MKAVFITPQTVTLGFEPIMWLRTQEMIQTLVGMGISVVPIEVSAFAEQIRRPSKKTIDFIVAPNFNYFLEVTADQTELLDSLNIPVIALWDDPLGALANFVNRYPGRLEKYLNKISRAIPLTCLKELTPVIVDRFRNSKLNFTRIMSHPSIKHFSWDSGHIQAVDSLGLLGTNRVTWYPMATYAAFLESGLSRKETTRDVGFCGNVYIGSIRESTFFKNQQLRDLTMRVCDRKLHSLHRPVWSLMIEEIDNLPQSVRRQNGLYDYRKSFWDYYLFLVWNAATTLVRLGIFSKVKRDISLHGLFADPTSLEPLKEYPNLKYEGNAHNFNGLPEIYATTKINLCLSNGLIYEGMPSKLIECLASGGFALCDPKEDLLRFFGPIVEKIFFRNAEDLNAKIDYYLARPQERDEIVAELGQKIRQQCTLEGLFSQVVECVRS